MKLRKLTLQNVRRFANKTAILGPFGDGLTTITAENENGKSTFFDALHALFFYEYGSGKKELKDMQPYSGGAMRIAAQIELEGADYLIEKVFNLKKAGSSATITDMTTGSVLKQADDAELWIHQNILTVNNGPFGLLWVRQGTVGVDASADGIEARRDVMSSVRGQIDAVTGGRRMDSIVQRCKQELDTISTKQDKPKAGSEWKTAVDRVDQLNEEHDRLVELVSVLSSDLGMKKRVAIRLRELQAPELRLQRSEAISAAETLLNETREHHRKVQDAEKDILLLSNEDTELDRKIKSITQARAQRAAIGAEIAEKELAVENAGQKKEAAREALAELQRSIAANAQELRKQREILQNIRQSERETAKRKRLAYLFELTQQLEDPKKQLCEAAAILEGGEITRDAIDRVSELESRRDIAIETRRIRLSQFTVSADKAMARIDGDDVPNGEPRLIDRPMVVNLPGFGTMSLQPAAAVGQEIADPEVLQADIDADLNSMGVNTVAEARRLYETRQAAKHAHQTAQMQIRALAPDGVEAIEREWRTLCAELNHPENLPATFSADDALQETTSETIERDISEGEEALEALQLELPPLQRRLDAEASALTEVEVLLRKLRGDQAELFEPTGEAEALAALTEAKVGKAHEVAQARAALEGLKLTAADLSAVKAQHQRAVQADEEDRKEIHRLERDLARLDGAIRTQSEGAVEEKLAEVAGKLVRAKERAVQFEDHVKALRLLVSHLEAARAEAQETYFEPVRNELFPLLRQLHAGADFQIDADKLLIETITRNGVTDKIDALSGGAYEQIAILTRLAFARLFSKQGNHVPIILDDALVHTDDERISTMFNMLAQIARDQQIIVLSCRTRAFSDLGGQRAFITELAEGA
ncbi:AAA family ATPase [Lentibacter sp. XHP0401]|uniref:AAA family ATPase n=1 Tax=Lentibacter sp. XHP0401 TaxID=2984334 RepID=UPI0021E80DAD|nr:AAA family ATPase [Lentibacter sp. XHP0401]MCV2892396.1 AAA family ATPase [Lentibacter sp. XHP0401]